MTRRNFCLAIVAAASLVAAGCAGGTFSALPYAGSYSGSGTVDREKTGTLTFVSNEQGLISGTFEISGTEAKGEGYSFTIGTYNVAGSITSTSGNWEVGGTVPEEGEFVIRGSYPALGQNKTYTVRAGGKSWTGTITRTN